MALINQNIILVFSTIIYLYDSIHFAAARRALNWDHQNLDPVPGILHDSTNIPATSPVQFYQIGHNGRTEYMYAQVDRHHLNTGSGTTSTITTYARNLGGDNGDDAGHVLASKLGGSGSDERNIIPQNPSCNKVWYDFIENVVVKEVERHGKTDYRVKVLYTGAGTRPSMLMAQIKLHDGTNYYYTNELVNPPSSEKCGN